MYAGRGWRSLSTNVDKYSVDVQIRDTISRPGLLMFSRWASIMKLSGLELGQVNTTRLGSLWTFGIVLNVARRGLVGISFKTSFCK